MADAIMLHKSGDVIEDISGDPVIGAKLEVFAAGTSNQLTVYSDASLTVPAANPVVTSGNGVVPIRWIGTDAWKMTFKDSSDAVLANYPTVDNARGQTDTSSFLTGTVAPSREIINVATSQTLDISDLGKQINANATGGDITITLPSAITMGDSGDYLVKNSGEAGTVTIATSASQTIDGELTLDLSTGDAAVTRSDGANISVGEGYKWTSGLVVVTFNTTLAIDVSLYPDGTSFVVTATADYTLEATNERIGQTFRIIQVQDGTGGRIATFNADFKFDDVGALQSRGPNDVDIFECVVREVGSIETTVLRREQGANHGVPDVVLEHQEPDGTDGGTATLGSWETRTLNTTVRNRNSFMFALASNEFTLVPGTYWIYWSAMVLGTNASQSRLFDVTATAEAKTGTSVASDGTVSVTVDSVGGHLVTITSNNAYRIESQVTNTNTNTGYGIDAGHGSTNVYVRVEIWRI